MGIKSDCVCNSALSADGGISLAAHEDPFDPAAAEQNIFVDCTRLNESSLLPSPSPFNLAAKSPSLLVHCDSVWSV